MGVIVRGEEQWHIASDRLADVRVPPTLTGVLQARLDTLPREEKQLLQRASVVGRLFWDTLVAELADAEIGQVDALLAVLLSGSHVVPFIENAGQTKIGFTGNRTWWLTDQLQDAPVALDRLMEPIICFLDDAQPGCCQDIDEGITGGLAHRYSLGIGPLSCRPISLDVVG